MVSIRNVGERFFDLFSLGHIALGFILFFISQAVLLKIGFPLDICDLLSLLFAVYFSIFWEFFENCLKIGMYLRPIKHVDSLKNSLSDIIFSILGSIIAFIIL